MLKIELKYKRRLFEILKATNWLEAVANAELYRNTYEGRCSRCGQCHPSHVGCASDWTGVDMHGR